MMWDGDGRWIVMWTWMALFWFGVIAGVVWLVSSLRRREGEGVSIERLVSGEIDHDEFRRREAALSTGERVFRLRVPVIAGIVALAVFIVIPAIVMSTGGWDMMGMHGRGRNTSASPVVQGGSAANVRIENFAFEPGNLEVPRGATVTWINEDSVTHDATAREGNWTTKRLSDGESDTLTFDNPGDYDYYCSIHPSMKSRLIVR